MEVLIPLEACVLSNPQSNKITDAGANTFAEFLEVTATLQNLDVSNNQMDAGALALAQTLRTNTRSQNLLLIVNYVWDASAQALAEALRTNTSLQLLYLSNNEPSQKRFALTQVCGICIGVATTSRMPVFKPSMKRFALTRVWRTWI